MDEIDEFISNYKYDKRVKSSSLSSYINEMMGKHGFDNAKELYKRAFISKQAFYKILSDKTYQPSLDTMVKLALALHLDNQECKYLLKKACYTLPSSSKRALVIRFCLDNKIYSIDKVNKLLMMEGEKTLS